MSDHAFFRNFGYKPPKLITYMTEELQSNLFIMEVYNNWNHIKQLMTNYKAGNLTNKNLDTLDQNWISNLIQNNIDLEIFKDEDEFYEKYIR